MESSRRAEFLRNVSFFQELPAEAILDLAERVSVTTFAAGQYLMREGEGGTCLFVLAAGRVGVYRKGLDGAENVITYLSPPEVTGEMAILDDSPRSASVKALERVEAIILEKRDFLAFIEAHPRSAFRIFQTLTGRLRGAMDTINAMASQSDSSVNPEKLAVSLSGAGADRAHAAESTRAEEEALGLYLVSEKLLDQSKMVHAMNRALNAGTSLQQVLIRMNLIDPATITAAEARWRRLRKARGGDPRTLLLNLQRAVFLEESRVSALAALSPEEIMDTLASELDLTDEDLLNIGSHGSDRFRRVTVEELAPEIARILPAALIDEHRVIPLAMEEGVLRLGMVSPEDSVAVGLAEASTGLAVEPWLLTNGNYRELRDELARRREAGAVGSSRAGLDMLRDLSGLLKRSHHTEGGEATLTLLEGVLRAAVQSRASDIHIEPMENRTRVRFRVDGMLQDIISIPIETHPRIVGAIKAAGDMDIANRLIPQDAKAVYESGGGRWVIRVSTAPTVRGEKVVMRLHKESDVTLGLRDLGPTEGQMHLLEKLTRTPYGMLLVTGPVGSGKTTTLYSILHSIDVLKTNIVTIEDPIEYELPGINHIEVNPKSGLTYLAGLRAILRQDPDVIMLGEIRDRETAQIATRAACTGVLMLSTLHTNDAPSAVTALLHLGVEPFFIVNALIGIIAQRLVRVVCGSCAETYSPAFDVVKSLGLDPAKEYHFRRGLGCSACGHSGFKGRIGIFEIMKLSQGLRDAILKGAPESEIRRLALEEGMATLRQSAVSKVIEGKTTPEELLRKTAEDL